MNSSRVHLQRVSLIAVALLFAGNAARSFADRGALKAITVQSLSVSPRRIRLDAVNRRQRVLVTAEDARGGRFDVTADCALSVEDAGVAVIDDSMIRPVSDGTTQLRVRFAAHRLVVPIIVKGSGAYPLVHFENDVVPVLSKLGCNSGSCHGKQSGKNGFKLSVFGFDPHADHEALTKEARGRRVFSSDPGRSLLVMKATGQSAHGGGRRTEADSADARLLTEWIRQGTPWGPQRAPRVTGLRVEPSNRVMRMKSAQQILVTAVFSNGSVRDVTDAAAYTSNSGVVAEVNSQGRILSGQVPGEAAVTVNYMGQVAAVQVLVPRPQALQAFPTLPRNNQIDGFVWEKLRKMGILPSGLADDATFLRRLSIDAIGRLPRTDEVQQFLADERPDRRERMIDSVLNREEYADHWAMKWADLLLIDQESLGERGAYEFHRWLREQFVRNRPYDQWIRELLTATGNSGKHGPVNFFRALRTPEELARAVSQALLGVRLDCAQCHHHPFEKWGQHDFYGMAGFFNGIERKKLRPGREMVYHAGYRTTKLPLTGEVVLPSPPGGIVSANLEDGDPRVPLARWVTDPTNPWFARLTANRLWKNFLGRGLVEPEDDFRSTNPPTNERLLQFLAQYLVDHKYDLKALMRLVLRSRVYQLSSVPNPTNADDNQNFSHHVERRLSAAILLDAICDVTGVPEQFPGMPAGTRAVQVWDNRLPSYFLDTFGRSLRKSPCECGTASEPTMAQALHLMNAPEIEGKLSSPQGRVAMLIDSGVSREKLVEELSLAALGRYPSQKEQLVAAELFRQDSFRQAAEDFLWTLLNSYDFLFIR